MESPAEAAATLGDELLAILRQLNRAEMEATATGSLEVDELRHALVRTAHPTLTTPDVERAVSVLVGNGFARELDDPTYAWDRGRVLGTRYAITTEGKAFLLARLARPDRVR